MIAFFALECCTILGNVTGASKPLYFTGVLRGACLAWVGLGVLWAGRCTGLDSVRFLDEERDVSA